MKIEERLRRLERWNRLLLLLVVAVPLFAFSWQGKQREGVFDKVTCRTLTVERKLIVGGHAARGIHHKPPWPTIELSVEAPWNRRMTREALAGKTPKNPSYEEQNTARSVPRFTLTDAKGKVIYKVPSDPAPKPKTSKQRKDR